jgi:hypothetical protein
MDLLVALPAENQGLTPTRGHPSDQEGFLPPPWLTQVREFADVVNFAVRRSTEQFAGLSEKALDHLTAMAVYLLRLIVEDGLLMPSLRDAAKPCHQWFLPAAPCVSGFQYLEGAVGRLHRRLVLPEDLTHAGAVLIREGEDQRKLHDAVDPPLAVDIRGEQVVLDEAPVFRLVLRHDAVIRIVDAGRQVEGLASPHVPGALRSKDVLVHLQSGYAVDTASVLGTALLVVGVLIDDFVAEEPRGLGPGVGDQGLLL